MNSVRNKETIFKTNNDNGEEQQNDQYSQSNAQGLFDDYNSQNDFGGRRV